MQSIHSGVRGMRRSSSRSSSLVLRSPNRRRHPTTARWRRPGWSALRSEANAFAIGFCWRRSDWLESPSCSDCEHQKQRKDPFHVIFACVASTKSRRTWAGDSDRKSALLARVPVFTAKSRPLGLGDPRYPNRRQPKAAHGQCQSVLTCFCPSNRQQQEREQQRDDRGTSHQPADAGVARGGDQTFRARCHALCSPNDSAWIQEAQSAACLPPRRAFPSPHVLTTHRVLSVDPSNVGRRNEGLRSAALARLPSSALPSSKTQL